MGDIRAGWAEPSTGNILRSKGQKVPETDLMGSTGPIEISVHSGQVARKPLVSTVYMTVYQCGFVCFR